MKDCAPRFPLLAPLVLTAMGLFGVAIATIQIVFVARDLERVGVVTVMAILTTLTSLSSHGSCALSRVTDDHE